MPSENLADRIEAFGAPATGDDEEQGRPAEPTMPVMPFPTFTNVPTLPQQAPGNGFESGRDSRAR